MATRPTRDIPPGKEKRGTSPSNVPNTTRTTTQRGRSPNPPKNPVSPDLNHDPNASEKPVPNYLKPTLSSSLDVSKQQGKKTVSKTETTQKPTLVRRRSFDKPPSTSQSQRSRISPNPTLRSSSSFSGKTISPQKGVPDKNLKTPKDAGKQHTLYARPLNTAKKGGIYIKKHETVGDNSSTAKEKGVVPPQKVDNVNVHDVPEPEVQFEDQELAVAQGEEHTVQNGDEIVKGDENSFTENQEPISIEQTEGENAKIVNLESSIISDSVVEDQKPINNEQIEDKDDKTSTFESFTILEQQEPVKIEQAEGKSENKDAKIVAAIESSTISEFHKDSVVDNQEAINIKQTEGDSENTDAKIVNNFESPENLEHKNAKIESVESLAVPENQDVSVGVKTEEPEGTKQEELKEDTNNEMNNIINTDQSVAGNISEEVEEKKREEEAHGTKEKEVQEVIVEKKPEVVNAAPKVQMAHGKKDIAVSNDVIEETASKLREQRKNKVKALAGAFETVISLQDPK